MVLISSSTISVAISSSIIGVFTLLLFLSGFILQQRSVRELQAVLRPPDLPKINHWPPQAKAQYVQKLRNDARHADLHTKPEDEDEDPKKGKSARLFGDANQRSAAVHHPTPSQRAFLQVLTRPSASDICSSILLFNTLASNSSLELENVLLYPRSWDFNPPMKSITSALEVLRATSAEHNVALRAMNTKGERGRVPSEMELLKDASASLVQYERIMYLRAPGLLVDVEKIDDLFTSLDTTESQEDGGRSDGSQLWTQTQISTTAGAVLPPALLVTLQSPPSGQERGATHVLRPAAQDVFVDDALASYEKNRHPAYVHFRREFGNRREKENVYYRNWKQELKSVCHGIDISH